MSGAGLENVGDMQASAHTPAGSLCRSVGTSAQLSVGSAPNWLRKKVCAAHLGACFCPGRSRCMLRHRTQCIQVHHYAGCLTAADAEPGRQHVPCKEPCSRGLLCGHQCTKACHAKEEPCSGCNKRCPVRCAHGHCSQACSTVRHPGWLQGYCISCQQEHLSASAQPLC